MVEAGFISTSQADAAATADLAFATAETAADTANDETGAP